MAKALEVRFVLGAYTIMMLSNGYLGHIFHCSELRDSGGGVCNFGWKSSHNLLILHRRSTRVITRTHGEDGRTEGRQEEFNYIITHTLHDKHT